MTTDTSSSSSARPFLLWTLILGLSILTVLMFRPDAASQWIPFFVVGALILIFGAYISYYSRSVTVTFLMVIALFSLFAVYSLYMRDTIGSSNAFEADRAQHRLETRLQLEKESTALLNGTGWTDPAKGTVHIPITDAIPMEIEALKRKTPHAAYAIVIPAPAPAPATVTPAKPGTPTTATPPNAAQPNVTPLGAVQPGTAPQPNATH